MGKIVRVAAAEASRRAWLGAALAQELEARGVGCALVLDPGQSPGQWRATTLICPSGAQGQELVEVLASQVDVVVDTREGAGRGVVVGWMGEQGLGEGVELAAVKAVVGGQMEGARSFEPEDIQGLGQWLRQWLGEIPAERARIIVDGRRLPAKDFVQQIVAEAVLAMVGALKGGQGSRVVVVARR